MAIATTVDVYEALTAATDVDVTVAVSMVMDTTAGLPDAATVIEKKL